jgi:hypothetical protein
LAVFDNPLKFEIISHDLDLSFAVKSWCSTDIPSIYGIVPVPACVLTPILHRILLPECAKRKGLSAGNEDGVEGGTCVLASFHCTGLVAIEP